MPDATIATWSEAQLVRFIQNMIRLHPPESAINLTVDEVSIVKTLKCFDQIQVYNHQFTVGAAGTAAALPANPVGYLRILDYGGHVMVIPYYNS